MTFPLKIIPLPQHLCFLNIFYKKYFKILAGKA
jgi:hypothetical protein